MEFTEEERKMITWLRQQHGNWRWVRMITLTSSVLCALYAFWEIFKMGYGAHPLILMVVASQGISYTLGSWVGRPEVSLLLKLIEAQKIRDRDQQDFENTPPMTESTSTGRSNVG